MGFSLQDLTLHIHCWKTLVL